MQTHDAVVLHGLVLNEGNVAAEGSDEVAVRQQSQPSAVQGRGEGIIAADLKTLVELTIGIQADDAGGPDAVVKPKTAIR